MRESLLNIAVQAARIAGDIIIRAADRPDTIKTILLDATGTYVTNVELQANQAIKKFITKFYPNHSFISADTPTFLQHEQCWIISSVDGINNFMRGLPHFAVSIAYSYRQCVEHGVIYDPWRQELFTASRGKGARLNERRIRVVAHKKLGSCFLGVNLQKNITDNNANLVHNVLPLCQEIRYTGATALDLAYVACGRLDGYYAFGCTLWQIAAGIVLIKEAGGIICDHNSGEQYSSNGNIVTANAVILRQLLIILQNTYHT